MKSQLKMIAAATFLSLSFAFGQVAEAAVINPSFEAPELPEPGNSFIIGATGWTAINEAGVQDFSGVPLLPAATDGEQHAYTNGPASFGGTATLYQTLTDIIVDGGVYTLTVDVGQFSGFSGSEGTIRLFGNANYLTPLSNGNGTAELSGIAPTPGTYSLNQTVTYTALASGDPFAGQFLGIALVGSVGTQVEYDNVRLDITSTEVSVPEPGTLTLLGLGLAGLGMRRRGKAC
ncbi:MAG: PEP-CTERM sorting domain-containing protein [Alphaproteobacteria bacterium]|nr:PEP-CTERM sorting domain-containing protein [Alphaproteobacteria bacterium]